MDSNAYNYESITVAGTAIGITASILNAYKTHYSKPAGRAFMTLETSQIRYRYDGSDPTAAEGHILNVGETLMLEGDNSLRNFRAIRTGGTSGILKVSIER